jgi:rare lipoprotein A
MKKGLILLCLVLAVALAWSQTTPLNKQKTIVAKDTLKKNKTAATEIIVEDTIPVKPFQLKPFKKSVIASYYADKFNGRRTTSGNKSEGD